MNQEHHPSNNQYHIPEMPKMSPQQVQQEQGKDKKKSRKGVAAVIGGGVAGLVIAGTAVVGGIKLGQDNDKEPVAAPDVETSAPAVPDNTGEAVPTPTAEATEQTAEDKYRFVLDPERTYVDEYEFAYYEGYSQEAIEAQIKSLEFPDNLSLEEYARADAERLTDWRNAGATELNYEMGNYVVKNDGSYEGYTRKEWALVLAEENTKMFAPAVFGENWADGARSNTLAADMTQMNADVLVDYFNTQAGYDPEDLEPYADRYEFTDMIPAYEGTDDERLIRYSMTMHTNADKNTVVNDLDGSVYDRTVTTEKVNGVEYATDWITSREY